MLMRHSRMHSKSVYACRGRVSKGTRLVGQRLQIFRLQKYLAYIQI